MGTHENKPASRYVRHIRNCITVISSHIRNALANIERCVHAIRALTPLQGSVFHFLLAKTARVAVQLSEDPVYIQLADEENAVYTPVSPTPAVRGTKGTRTGKGKQKKSPRRKDSVVPAADNSNPCGEPETQSTAVAQEIGSLVAEAVGEKLDAAFGKLTVILSAPKRSREWDKPLSTPLKKRRVEHPLEASQSQADSDHSDNEEDGNAAELSDSSGW